MFHSPTSFVIAVTLLAFTAASAAASVVHYEVDQNSGDPNTALHAAATITTSADTVTVTLTNLGVDARSVAQNISGFTFTLSDTPAGLSLTNFIATSRYINMDATYTDGTFTPEAWPYSLDGAEVELNSLTGTGKRKWTILGEPNATGHYANANKSLTGEHANPSIGLTATFQFNAPGVSQATDILAGAEFWFNTDADTNPANRIMVPEPASLALFAAGLLLISKPRRAR